VGPIVLAQDVITPEKAATMAQNFRDGGHVKVLAQVLWDWQANGILNQKNNILQDFAVCFVFLLTDSFFEPNWSCSHCSFASH